MPRERTDLLPRPRIEVDVQGRAVVGVFARGYSLGAFRPARLCDISGDDRRATWAFTGVHMWARDIAEKTCLTSSARIRRRVLLELDAQAGRLMAEVRR